MKLSRDLNSMQNRIIAQDYEEQRRYLTDNIVTMRAMFKKYKKINGR